MWCCIKLLAITLPAITSTGVPACIASYAPHGAIAPYLKPLMPPPPPLSRHEQVHLADITTSYASESLSQAFKGRDTLIICTSTVPQVTRV